LSDIFISYASEDRERAKELADALTARGWSVWWDRHIPIGKSFSRVIEEQLAAARCVIVLWSGNSVSSDWVQNEAADGNARGLLVPALIADVQLPLEFRRLQTANLTDWQQGTTTPELEKLMTSVAELVQPAAAPAVPVLPIEPPRPQRWVYLAAGAAVLAIIIAIAVRRCPSDGQDGTATDTTETTDTTITTTTTTTTEPPPPPPDPTRAVGLLIANGRPKCTAFLIADDIAVTALSCVETSPLPVLRLGTARRDYRVESVLARDRKKGIATLRVGGSPGSTFPPISRTRAVRPGDDVILSGTPCNVVEVRAGEFRYRCATRDVDRGAPVFDKDNQLLGVHVGNSGRTDPQLNRGIPASAFPALIRR